MGRGRTIPLAWHISQGNGNRFEECRCETAVGNTPSACSSLSFPSGHPSDVLRPSSSLFPISLLSIPPSLSHFLFTSLSSLCFIPARCIQRSSSVRITRLILFDANQRRDRAFIIFLSIHNLARINPFNFVIKTRMLINKVLDRLTNHSTKISFIYFWVFSCWLHCYSMEDLFFSQVAMEGLRPFQGRKTSSHVSCE